MKENLIPFRNTKKHKLICVLSIFIAVFCLAGKVLNIYRYALLGGIYEL